MESSNHQEQQTWESSTNAIPKPQTPSSEGFHLPIEIRSNILSRLSLPTVLLCRSVCKAWSQLTRTDAFIQQHMKNFGQNETNHGSVHISSHFCEYTLEYCSEGHSRSVKINDKTPEWYTTSNCCNGLVCVYNQDVCNFSILIINPAIDDNFVELPDVGMTKCQVLNVCLCHDDHANKYKVVRFYCCSDDKGMGIEVLTLGDTTWRQVGKVPTRFRGSAPLYASGVMHWMTYEDKIFFFKTTEETIGLIECPAGDTSVDDEDIMSRISSDLTVYEGCLCIVRRHWHPWKLMFFVMEDYINRVWIEHVIDLMEMDETPFSHKDGFDRCPQYRSIKVQNGKLLLQDKPRFHSYPQEKFYYYNPKTESFEKCDGTPRWGDQYKESFVSASRICNEKT